MIKRVLLAFVVLAAPVPSLAQTQPAPAPIASDKPPSKTKEYLTDAVVAAMIIAASISAYKASGRPCACPDDMMRNGRRCGGNSAWARAGGAKPLCFISDITASMINAFRATKSVPSLR